jgi:hypothetical protein
MDKYTIEIKGRLSQEEIPSLLEDVAERIETILEEDGEILTGHELYLKRSGSFWVSVPSSQDSIVVKLCND